MARLIVRNIGPIKDVDIELKKVNVFIGPQGCGKSTLAKIVSFCSWLEKDSDATGRAETGGLVSLMMKFHRMEGYFREDSELAYIGDDVAFFYHFPEPLPLFWNPEEDYPSHYHEDEVIFHKVQRSVNPKVIYIPAERNFVSVVPNLKKYSEKDDSLQSFVNDWFEAKKAYTEQQPLKIDMLGIEYYYNEKTDSDIVVVDGQKIRLNQSSSGFQSVVPLMALLSYLSSIIYEENKPFSPAENEQMREILSHVSSEVKEGMEQKLIDRIKGFLQGKVYSHTQFIVEEPEQNLFPNTQCDLMYHLLSCLNHGKAHRAVITTHSPYILYALNNCLLANIVREEIPEEERDGLDARCADVVIAPTDVCVWEIEDGCMKTYDEGSVNNTIQDKDGLVRQNYFNSVMGNVMRDFNNLLMYKD
jgi:predicted ATPase